MSCRGAERAGPECAETGRSRFILSRATPLNETVGPARVILVDASETSREVMVRRLSAQGYAVEAAADPMSGADMALSAPPAAVIADFWVPGISGIQLCRLLRTEPATADVPVILRGDDDDPRSRFWAERAGAVGTCETCLTSPCSKVVGAARRVYPRRMVRAIQRQAYRDARGRRWSIALVPVEEAAAEDARFWWEELTPEQRVVAVDTCLESALKARGVPRVPRLRRTARVVKRRWR